MHNVFIYIACMAGVTYIIRVLPLTLIRKEIKNRTVRSFLYYVPYVTLAVMTFPSIISATQSPIAALIALLAAMALAYFGRGLFFVAVSACVIVFVIELFTNPPAAFAAMAISLI
ncbi:MAG: AzlD domain-containing protein [Clostridia bacterium]|nr:AzlD domain-containing protein [Clostridia bacterium]